MEKFNKKKIYYNFILALSKNNGIGKNGKLPWNIPSDMAHFKTVTTKVFEKKESLNKMIANSFIKSSKNILFEFFQINKIQKTHNRKNIVVMGRSTWESIPVKFRPLSDRINIVFSKNSEFMQKNPSQENIFYTVSDIEEFFKLAENLQENKISEEIFVIGGSQIYSEFLSKYPQNLKLIYQTLIEKEYDSDVFFETPKDLLPLFVSKTMQDDKEPDTCFDFRILANKNIFLENLENDNFSKIIDPFFLTQYPKNEEFQYLDAIRDIIETGIEKNDRTGVGTISKFGLTMRFDCSKSFPILTTKDTFWRGIVEELIWFINGDTNAKNLQAKKVHIWDGNASREFLDKLGLTTREEGDLGPVYGFQWRHSGAEYKTMHDDYKGQGIDQLVNCINEIKNNPDSRRIIMCSWNPKDLSIMALPPCHVLCQFYVENGKLSLQMYQRSADMGLGIPFNIASYSLLLCMIAQVTNLKPGNFIHTIGDAHVYKTHLEAVKKQLLRIPRAFPILKINDEVKDIEKFKF